MRYAKTASALLASTSISALSSSTVTSALSTLILVCFLLLLGVGPAYATKPVSIDNVQAAMRTLQFIESLPQASPLVVGVLYSPETPDGRRIAESAAQLIGTMNGPNSRRLQPLVLSTQELDQFQGHLDVLWLSAGVCEHGASILDSIRRHHLVSLSDDAACVDAQCCVIAVRTGSQVNVTLNTALADAVGARFSLVFIMVVNRR